MKPRQPIPKVSKARAILLVEYRKVKVIWRATLKAAGQWLCSFPGCQRPPDRNPHHKFGRVGKLLCWIPGFLPICNQHHNWVGNNPDEARKLGLLCERGQWGKQPTL